VWPEWVSLAQLATHFSPSLDSRHAHLPADSIPEIIKRLPAPLPGLEPRSFVLSAWPLTGHRCITLAVRRNALPDVHTWYWAIEAIDQIAAPGSRVMP
jgi:hypothetical protein